MAFAHHDHEGFRPGRRSKKQKRRPLSVQDLVLRATEEVTAKRDWLSECRGLIRDCSELGPRYRVMCLGLGSISELSDARVQLVFLQLVLQYALDIMGESVTIFDPVFTPGDASYLRDHVGYVVLSAQPENYATNPDTVVYMPHCDLSLFERFLRDNWFPERIQNIILVGNTLSDYADNCQQFVPVYRSWRLIWRVGRYQGWIHFARRSAASLYKGSETRPLYQNAMIVFGVFKVKVTP